MSENTVFISYSHDTPAHSRRVRELADTLLRQGVGVELDQYEVRPPQGWPQWCEEQLRPERSAFVLMICTEIYRQRIEGKAPADEGRGVFWEGRIIANNLYADKANRRFIPVLLDDTPGSAIPQPFPADTRYRLKAFDLDDQGYCALYRELTGQPAVIKPILGPVVQLPPEAQGTVHPLPPLPSREVRSRFIPADISRIVKYAPVELIGREEETKLLHDAWAKVQSQEPRRPHVLTIVALGGEGKTSLVGKWAADLADQDWPGCDAVFAWSFYSQGTREQTAVSSDLFLAEALAFFGDAAMAASSAGAFDKGRRLAQLVGERRALLILDGLEPLQYAPTSPTPGELKDQGVAALLKGLAGSSQGLCVVTTRYAIPDLRLYWQTSAPMHALARLSTAAGVKLLRSIGVTTGSQAGFEKLVEDVNGHALTLQILGQFLVRAFRGDIRRRDRISFEKANAKIQGGHAFRAMEAYVKWMENESEEARRELALLRLLGLFDRPATEDCLAVLRQKPAIPDLTEPLVGLVEDDWEFSLTSLSETKLLTVSRAEGSGELLALDAHPLLREYFAHCLRQQHPEAWRAAHHRLYEHLCATTKEGKEPTLDDLQPLYQAVAHGCQAGLQQEARKKVYEDRILKGAESGGFYSTNNLGAFGSDLGAVACFFETPWSRVSPALTEADQAWLLNQAACRLRALGRLTEALEPMRAGLAMRVKQKNWRSAAIIAGNLSGLDLTLGEVTAAIGDAEESVRFADRSGDAFWRMGMRTTHADALHQAGRRAEAEAHFREAEQMQAEGQPGSPLLYSLQGFQYCDLLLAEPERTAWRTVLESAGFQPAASGIWPEGLARAPVKKNQAAHEEPPPRADPDAGATQIQSCQAVAGRATQTLKIAERHNSLLIIALDHLTLGRAALYASILESGSGRALNQDEKQLEHATAILETAVAQLRRAGQLDDLPRGLLTRAWLRGLCGGRTGPESAQGDLDEAWEIAARGPMPLFLADIHLHRARLFFREAPYPWESPEHDLREARRLIEKHGYGRRLEELEDAEAVVQNASCR